VTDWPWDWLYWYATVKLGWSDRRFWTAIPRLLFAMVDIDQAQRVEDAITIGYACRLDDPSKLRVKSEEELIAEREAAIDAFVGF